MHLTPAELNPHNYPLTKEQQSNFDKHLVAINKFREVYGKPMVVTSGVRSTEDQKRINPKAMNSAHVQAAATDFSDIDGRLARFCLDHLELLRSLGLYMESPERTPRWVHLQSIPTRSGTIVFQP